MTRIHINRHIIRANAKGADPQPPITVATGKKIQRAYAVEIDGPSTLIYRPEKPLSCGATTWIETRAPVRITTEKGV